MITKRCTICKNDLPADSDHFAGRTDKNKPTLQSSCRVCHKEYRKKHYHKNKETYIQKAKKHTLKVFDWFTDLKATLKCENCGDARYWVLDFHHNSPSEKEGDVAKFAKMGSKQKILKEIKKCKVLCANCHRDFHYKEKQDVA